MYLVDTDVISEARKGEKGNPGVRQFFRDRERDNIPLYLSAITIGELRQGVEGVRHRGDESQARLLERWLNRVTSAFGEAILAFDEAAAEIWGRQKAGVSSGYQAGYRPSLCSKNSKQCQTVSLAVGFRP